MAGVNLPAHFMIRPQVCNKPQEPQPEQLPHVSNACNGYYECFYFCLEHSVSAHVMTPAPDPTGDCWHSRSPSSDPNQTSLPLLLQVEGMEWLVDPFNQGELTALEDAEEVLGRLIGYQVGAATDLDVGSKGDVFG